MSIVRVIADGSHLINLKLMLWTRRTDSPMVTIGNFLRVLRQLRDLRRYAPVVIQNAQEVNVGNQQIMFRVELEKRPVTARKLSRRSRVKGFSGLCDLGLDHESS